MKNNWISAISEDEATGETAEIFRDIKTTLGNGVVNLIWRHIATIEGALPWVWQAVKPLYILDVLKNEAGFLCENIKLPEVSALPSAVLSAVNVLDRDRLVIQKILDSYNKGNAFNLLALSALTVLPEDNKKKVEAGQKFLEDINIPNLMNLDGMDEQTRTLVLLLSKLGAQKDNNVVPSLYRHLAYWPGFLSLSWNTLIPLELDGQLQYMTDQTYQLAAERAANIADVVVWGPEPLRAEEAMKAIDNFRVSTISRMLPIGLVLRTITG
jgi:hypothetical protein